MRFGGKNADVHSLDEWRAPVRIVKAIIVLLTQLGGGAFGNRDYLIYAATRRSLEKMRDVDLDVKLVSYGAPPPVIARLAKHFE
jgi:hypothetical protein